MRRSILSYANRVVRENVNRGDFHQRAEAHTRPHVVAKIEKRGAERAEFRKRHAIHDRAHGMFPHAEVDVAPSILIWIELSRTIEGQVRFVGLARSADPPTSQGIFLARAFRVFPEDSRVAMPFGSA